MAASFYGVGSRVDSSGAAVTTISVPRPSGLAVGDYVIVFAWAEVAATWTLPVGDGIPFTLLGSNAGWQCWGKFLGPGFGANTVINFSTAVRVRGAVNYVARGGASASASATNSLNAPDMYRLGNSGVAVRLFGAVTQPGNVALSISGQTTRVPGTSDFRPILIADKAYNAETNIPSAAATKSGSGTVTTALAVTVQITPDAPPYAPVAKTPANGATVDDSQPQVFRWGFTSPITGDSQSRFVLNYANSDNSDVGTIDQISPNTYCQIPAGTFAPGDYQWTVQVYGQRGGASNPSAASFFTAIDHPAGPTVTYPSSGGTVNQADRVDWSYPTQDAYQVQRVADNPDGTADTLVYFDSGTVFDSGNITRSQPLSFPVNNRYEHILLRVRTAGIWSPWTDTRVLVSYTPPAPPTVTVYEGDDGASIAVGWASPTPGDGQPAATYVDVGYSTDGGQTATRYWAGRETTGSDVYQVPQDGLDYVWRATAYADNGTSASSDWITRGTLTTDQVT